MSLILYGYSSLRVIVRCYILLAYLDQSPSFKGEPRGTQDLIRLTEIIQRVSFGSGVDFKGRRRAPGAARARSGRWGRPCRHHNPPQTALRI